VWYFIGTTLYLEYNFMANAKEKKTMKTNKKRWLGMSVLCFVIALVFGMAVVGCEEEEEDKGSTTTSEYDGTWVKDTYQFIISGSSFTWKMGDNVMLQGNISFSGTTCTATANGVPTTFTVDVSGNTATISGLTDAYSSLNGNWTRQ
jgi:hypothetical protein